MKIIKREPVIDGIALYVSPDREVVYATAYYRVMYEDKVPGKKCIYVRERIEKGTTLQVGNRNDADGAHLRQLIEIADSCVKTIRRACWDQDEKLAKQAEKRKKPNADWHKDAKTRRKRLVDSGRKKRNTCAP